MQSVARVKKKIFVIPQFRNDDEFVFVNPILVTWTVSRDL